MIRIAQFNHPENGGLYGRPGDQLFPADGKTAETFEAEVNIAPVGTGWKRIFRPVDPEQGDEIADLMERTARNPHIGYSQGPTRYSFGDALRLSDNDPDRIETDCNADCSSGTAAICNAAGCGVNPEMTTATEKRDLMTSRKFLIIGQELRIKPELMHSGDILWRDGHTAIVIDAGGESALTLIMYASEQVKMRLGPGVVYPSIGEIPAGRLVLAFAPYLGPKGWAPVLYEGRRCWVSLKYIKPTDPDDVILVTGWKVNIRSGAWLGAPVLETAGIGDRYLRDWLEDDQTDERGVTWYAVRLRTKPGKSGYISSMYAEVME